MCRPSDPLPSGLHGQVPTIPEFSSEQRRTLLRIAHDAILFAFEPACKPGFDPSHLSAMWPGLQEARGVFTTLYVPGTEPRGQETRRLRGCVGYALAVTRLDHAVAETARAAAFDDSRFSPVTREEASQLLISLSVLSPLFPIRAEAVEPGHHGLLVSQGSHHGLLLPQVPLEYGWDRETFLAETCRKAGLAPDAWRQGATLQAFTAEVFGDG